MKCESFNENDQNKLEDFMNIVYSVRGYKFDAFGLHRDVRNINEIYKISGGDFWIIKDNDLIIGSIALKLINQKEKIGEIKRYFVLPNYQGKGFGKMLMEFLINESKNRGLLKLRLDTMKESLKAISIFRKYGFYEIQKYNDNDIAEIFMERIC